jgi:hypothetical protein
MTEIREKHPKFYKTRKRETNSRETSLNIIKTRKQTQNKTQRNRAFQEREY